MIGKTRRSPTGSLLLSDGAVAGPFVLAATLSGSAAFLGVKGPETAVDGPCYEDHYQCQNDQCCSVHLNQPYASGLSF